MSEAHSHDPTVFIVDDDPAARNSLAALVRSRQWQAETFASAEAFLAVVHPERPGCIITDLRMDGMDGLQFQERLVELGCLLPVIVVSGHADVASAVRLMENRAVTLLEKPYQQQTLVQAIERALTRNVESRQRRARLEDVETRMSTLTADELAALDLIMAGRANKAIATSMDTSMRTVDRRRRSILDKMQVDSIAELVRVVSEYRSLQPSRTG